MRIKTLLFLLSLGLNASGQSTVFQKAYGSALNDASYATLQNYDGDFIFMGKIETSPGVSKVHMVKLNSTGDTAWTRRYGSLGNDNEVAFSVGLCSDSGYIVGAVTSAFGAGNEDFYLVKTDVNGNFQWSRTIGGTEGERPYSIVQSSDGGFVLAGETQSVTGAWDFYLVKTNSSGTLLWTKTYGDFDDEMGRSVKETYDGGFIITGNAINSGTGISDVLLVRTDANGNLLWSKKYGGAGNDWACSVKETSDSGFVIAGITESFGAGGKDAYLIRTDRLGNLAWSKTYGGADDECARDVNFNDDGGYDVAGYTNSFGSGNIDALLLKTDSDGELIWSMCYGGVNDDYTYAIAPCTDGGWLLAGETKSFGHGGGDAFVIKTDSLGHSGCFEAIPFPTVLSAATITENPTTYVFSGGIENNPLTVICAGGCPDQRVCNVVLDHHLTFFFAEGKVDKSVSLTWKVESDEPGSQFLLERLTVAEASSENDYESIATISEAGLSYDWVDIAAKNVKGSLIYRLSSIQPGGAKQFLASKTVERSGNEDQFILHSISENESGTIQIRYTLAEEAELTLEIIDCFGKQIWLSGYHSSINSLNYKEIENLNLAKGMYFFRFRYGGESKVVKYYLGR